jgi:hypothetical protein
MSLLTKEVAYACSSHKSDAWHGKKSSAEAIAKSIKSKIEQDAKEMYQ